MKLFGFRSNKIWKKVMSIVYLIVWCLLFLVIMTEGKYPNLETKDFVINKMSNLIIFCFFISPYIFLSQTKIREKLPLLNKHKIGTSILFFVMLFVVTIFINSAILGLHTDEYDADMENHAYVLVASTEATCEVDGVIERTCEYCGRQEREVFPAKGHVMQVVIDDDDKTVEKCQICGHEETKDKNSEKLENKKEEKKEPTDEEKAEELLTTVSVKFSEGDYEEAIDICEKIKELYPDTIVVSKMDEYLDKEYSKISHYTAYELMSSYEENIVNADKEYTDKTIIISGKISEIGKTNNDRNLCVLLDSGTYFKCVQLNFDLSKTDEVAELKKGDSVKVLGKCTGKSGKHFLIFDGDNVMIENCYLIK